MKTLRDYQARLVDDVVKAEGNVLLGLPTGAGKTVIASEIVKKLPCKVVFLVPRVDLLQQAIDCFTEQGLKVSVIWRDIDEHSLDADVYISVRQTMYRKSYFSSFVKDKIIIVDEAHIGLEAQHDYYLKCKRVIGLTATPEQMSKKSMMRVGAIGDDSYAVYDTHFYPYQIKDLQEMGFLAKYQFDDCEHVDIPVEVKRRWKRMGKLEGDLSETEAILANNIDLIAATLRGIDEPTIVFAPTVDSANNILALVDSNKWAVVTGDTSKTERGNLYRKVESGELIGLINCAVLTTGFDLPCIKKLVLCRHILSKSLFVQIIGRALRPFSGKVAHIVDVMDSYSNFRDSISEDGTITWYPAGLSKVEGDPLDSIPDDKKDSFRKNPQGTLLTLMIEYKRAMEDMRDALDQYESNIEIKLPQRERVVEKEKIVEVVKTVNSKVTPEEINSYLLNGFFQDSRYIIPEVMRNIMYDKNDPEKVKIAIEEIWNASFNVSYRDMLASTLDYTKVFKRYKKMIEWWLVNFKLDYKKN